MHQRIEQKLKAFETEVNNTEKVIESIWDEFIKESDQQLMSTHQALQINDSQVEKQIHNEFEKVDSQLRELEEGQRRIESENTEREQTMKETVDFVKGEFLQNIEMERLEQKDSEAKIFALIEELEDTVNLKIKEEKQQGDKTHGDLLNLLETACLKIERSFLIH